jgi:ABC-type branched-subunit amino acid transport system substrate-binding protein
MRDLHASGRALLALVAALLVAVGIAACGSSSDDGGSGSASASVSEGGASSTRGARADCPVRYLVVTSVTGAQAQNGVATKEATEAAIRRVNDSGGVLGCDVEATYLDTGSDPTKSLPLLVRALAQQSYANVADIEYGAAATVPYLTQRRILSVTALGDATITGHPDRFPFMFDATNSFDENSAAAMDYAKQKGYTKVAAIVDNTAVGAQSAAGLEAGARRNGLEVTTVVRVPTNIVNAAPAITRARAGNPDVLYIDIFGTPAASVLKDLAASGWNVPVLGGQLSGATDMAALAPPDAIRPFTPIMPRAVSSPATPQVQSLLDTLRSNGVDTAKIQCITCYIFAYDTLGIFAYGANTAQSLDSDKIKTTLEATGTRDIPLLAAAPTTGYTDQSHVRKVPFAVVQAGELHDGLLRRIADIDTGSNGG